MVVVADVVVVVADVVVVVVVAERVQEQAVA